MGDGVAFSEAQGDGRGMAYYWARGLFQIAERSLEIHVPQALVADRLSVVIADNKAGGLFMSVVRSCELPAVLYLGRHGYLYFSVSLPDYGSQSSGRCPQRASA
jgi:hypothetical protein